MATRAEGLTWRASAPGQVPVISYEEALRYLYSFTNYETRAAPRGAFKLTRMERLLDVAERPERRYPSVLVAGTKGKGSTAAMLAAIATAAGKRVGFYSSPHLNTHRERYRLQGAPIAKDVFVQQVAQLPGLLAEMERRWPELGAVTLFELCTLLAFRWFAEEVVDLAVVEVGVGGWLDCTNVLRPQLSLIAPISYDHRDVLGNTLTEIAFEKAGIIKPGHLVLSAPQTDEAAAVLRRVAAEQSAPLRMVPPGAPVGDPLRIVAGPPLPPRLGQWFRPQQWPEAEEPCWLSL
ncbi:MAG: bifunctional folylpolyglutamate synthase/dihydrofolate synthase, partial [Chloroflexota bacterium]